MTDGGKLDRILEIQFFISIHEELLTESAVDIKVLGCSSLLIKWCNICIEPMHILLYTLNNL